MRHLASLAILLAALATPVQAQEKREEQRAPFTDLRVEGDGVLIRVDSTWYRWLELDEIPVTRILDAAHDVDATRWEKRIAEDLTSVLFSIDYEHADTVTLEVAPVEGGDPRTLRDVPMTWDKRETTRKERHWREYEADFEAYGARTALIELAGVITEHHAYAHLKGLDVDSLVMHELDRLGDDATGRETILGAQRMVCRLGDGHAGISWFTDAAPAGGLDFLIRQARGGFVAFRRDVGTGRGEPLVEDFPFIVSMDGVPIEDWIDGASAYVTDGSGALVRHRSAELLAHVNLVRDELGLEHRRSVALRLRDEQGRTAELSVPVAAHGAYDTIRPAIDKEAASRGYETRRLADGVAYVRLVRMVGEDETPALRTAVEALSDASAMIIDVRANAGGSRAPILALLPFFIDEPRVVNVAARLEPRTAPRPTHGWLADRHAYPIDWPGWTDAERASLERTMADFEPKWTPPGDRFSDWNAMVVSRNEDDPRFEGPVVILMDEGCFSATDIFLGAFKGVEGVTLMGSPSSGGSARSESHELDALQRDVRLATMVSYRADGRLYDTRGIQPDVLIEPTVDDLLGRTDSRLDAALDLLRSDE